MFHEGERAVQLRAGEAAMAERNGRMLSDTVMAGARPFIAQQFMLVAGSVGDDGALWASMLFGQPGFAGTDSGDSILLRCPERERDQADPFWRNIAANGRIGLLFIELATRRRFRVNGRVVRSDALGLEVAVLEAYPNCPKYIQRRELRGTGPAGGLPVAAASALAGASTVSGASMLAGGAGALPPEVADIVRRADTLFVASAHPEQGLDASHRGGHGGFVRVLADGTLRVPDYKGNSMFNTLGNFCANPRAGVVVPDFDGGRLLQISGAVDILWDLGDEAGQTGGTNRFWEFQPEHWILRGMPQHLEWDFRDPSPFNPAPVAAH